MMVARKISQWSVVASVLLLLPFFAAAQQPEPAVPAQQVIPDQFSSNDSLNVTENGMTSADSIGGEKISFADVDVPTFADSMYEARLKLLVTPIPLDYNQEVRNYIDLYVLKRRSQVERMLGLSKFYFPIFDQIFAQKGVPPEIKNLAIIESALNPHAVSKAGATGIWQFMYGTAKVYGLTVNNYYDERRDIIRSTEAAADYLTKMYGVYGDWLLAIASYNCGPQNVNRAIARSGGNTFWAIKDYLPKETRGYVPAFIAATYVMNFYELHDLETNYEALKHCWDSIAAVEVNQKMACEQIAKYTDMTLDELRFLNPGLRCSVIPALESPYNLKLPNDRAVLFTKYRDSISASSADAKVQYYYGPTGTGRVYVVKKGDNLGKIAARYHVSVSQIKKWNHLSSTVIRPGQKLKIYSSRYEEAVASGGSSSESSAAKPAASASVPKTSESTSSATSQYVYYKARYGDTLWDIARKHGTTVDEIRTLNGSAKCNNLKAGTVLKISSKG
jgi:membrane-bound lytic murein transglycosylase D